MFYYVSVIYRIVYKNLIVFYDMYSKYIKNIWSKIKIDNSLNLIF